MRHRVRFWLVLLCLPVFFSCIIIDFEFFKLDSDPKPEPKYKAEIIWKREFFGSISTPLGVGSDVYFYNSFANGVVKMNMETGKVLTEHDESGVYYRYPLKIGAYRYQPGSNGSITVFDDSSGNRAATIMMGENETEAKVNGMWDKNYFVVSGDYLFWGNFPDSSGNAKGLMRLDTTKIDFSKDPDEVQAVIPELVWSGGTWISVQMLAENGIVYFISRSAVLIAFDALTGTVLWEQEVPFISAGDYTKFPIVLHDDKILVLAKNISAYHTLTGDIIFEITGLETDNWHYYYYYYKVHHTLHNGFLYYRDIYGNSITAINLNTGKIVWINEVDSHCTYDTCDDWEDGDHERHFYCGLPHVYGDKLYIMSDTGLRVYNAADGKFIGVDKKMVIDVDYSIVYNDILAFWGNYPAKSGGNYVTAMRCK